MVKRFSKDGSKRDGVQLPMHRPLSCMSLVYVSIFLCVLLRLKLFFRRTFPRDPVVLDRSCRQSYFSNSYTHEYPITYPASPGSVLRIIVKPVQLRSKLAMPASFAANIPHASVRNVNRDHRFVPLC